MATAVRDLEFLDLPDEINNLEGYQRLLGLVYVRGRPVGRIELPVERGKVQGDDLRSAILSSLGRPFWDAWIRERLKLEDSWSAQSDPLPATIAICTRDRPEDLRRCLEGLARLPDDGQEILVVDSASAGEDTRGVVASFPQARYLREQLPGLNRARNRALGEARHPLVAFIDDDAVPDPGWLRTIRRNFTSPLVLCVTGLTMPIELETQAQEWFERFSPFSRGFTRKVYHQYNLNPLTPSFVGAGANMAFRREVIDLVGPFDPALDAGTPTLSGGDTEYFSRILKHGYRIIYEPAALNWHRHRRSLQELRQTIYGYGVGNYAFWTRALLVEGEISVFGIALWWFFLGQLPNLVKALLRRPESVPLGLLWAELRGCMVGPAAYLKSSQLERQRLK